MKVLFTSAEVAPFSKTGGLADVSGALPKALAELGVDIKIMVPYYTVTENLGLDVDKIDGMDSDVKVGDVTFTVQFLKGHVPDSDVEVIFIRCDELYAREGIYADPATNSDYPDNDMRFVVLNRAVLEFVRGGGWKPDLIHCQDNHTALIPAYIDRIYKDLKDIATILTIHNLGYQGIFPKKSLKVTGFDESLFGPMSPFEFYGQLNFMKIGIVHSDLINTVSETYAREITTTSEFGHKLEGILNKRKDSLFGIVNGIDDADWNPETDELIPAKYSSGDLSGKRVNKRALLEESGLDGDDLDAPLFGSVSRLADQKGFDIIAEIMGEFLSEDVRFVLLGTGDLKYHKLFERLAKKYPAKVGVHLTFNNRLAHLIEAGADAFLMPSKYEPCGLNQLYSLNYGTVPIVRATGGLADTVRDYTPEDDSGTGFVFDEYTPEALYETVKRAVDLYRDQSAWKRLMLRGMVEDFSWKSSAQKYVELYSKAIVKRKAR